MTQPLRVAFFTDSYPETNGIARLTRALEHYATERALPFVCVHGGPLTELTPAPVQRLQLRRGAATFRLEHDLGFDLLLWRHYRRVRDVLRTFRPDVVHITGPSDIGQLGAWLGHRLRIPVVASWHTNVHQYAALRSVRRFRWLPTPAQTAVQSWVERQALRGALLFYRVPRVLMAPNEELVQLLETRTGRPTHLMRHGVDTSLFSPAKRTRSQLGATVRIGFVGRLSAEKHVRLLAALDRALIHAGVPSQFIIVGEGSEREWLRQHVSNAEFPGVLTGESLARAYADMDLFVFPSASDTFGLVVLEAMASGVPVVAMAKGGPKFIVKTGTTGWLAHDDADFLASTIRLARDETLRRELGRAAREHARAWSWDSVFEELYRVYGTAIGEEPATDALVQRAG